MHVPSYSSQNIRSSNIILERKVDLENLPRPARGLTFFSVSMSNCSDISFSIFDDSDSAKEIILPAGNRRLQLIRQPTLKIGKPLSQQERNPLKENEVRLVYEFANESDDEIATRFDLEHAWNTVVQNKELDEIEEKIYQDKIFEEAKATALKRELDRKKAEALKRDLEHKKALEAERKRLQAKYTLLLDSDNDEDLFDDDLGKAAKQTKFEAPKMGKVRSSGKKSEEKPQVETGPRAMRWCFTWNNKNEEDAEILAKNLKEGGIAKGYAFQVEIGASGTEHIQGYIETNAQLRMTAIKGLFDYTVHVETAKKPKIACVRYCTKTDTRKENCTPFTWGTCDKENENKGPGRRTDIEKFSARVLSEGITLDLIEEEPGMMMQYNKHARDLLNLKRSLEMDKFHKELIEERIQAQDMGLQQGVVPRQLVLLFGPSAVGKTTWCENEAYRLTKEIPFMKPGSAKWWDVYNNQKIVVVDEWRKEFTENSLQQFNNITNYSPVLVEGKGYMMKINPQAMWFTTNRHPRDIFDINTHDEASFNALARRFAKVFWWTDKDDRNNVIELENPGMKPREDEFDNNVDYENAIKEWKVVAEPWLKFWKWKARPAVAGDSFDPDSNYFTL